MDGSQASVPASSEVAYKNPRARRPAIHQNNFLKSTIMCGIVGYIGPKDALPIILEGLQKLEYRGYDSAGVALYEDGKIVIKRAKGKLSALRELVKDRPSDKISNIGLGHTRWATHGKPSEENAHPHTAGRVSVIHNGIVENYAELKSELLKEGRKFLSETDTEITAHLYDRELEKGIEPRIAFTNVCKRLVGSYALLALDSKDPNRIMVAKTATPIIIGVGEGEAIIASDIPAVLEHTKKIIILEDGDIAEVTAEGISIENNGVPITREVKVITWDAITAQKGGFKHYMIKEIHEQPSAIADTLRGRFLESQTQIDLSELSLDKDYIKQAKRIVLLACGTAWHACLIAKFYIENIAKIPCEVDYASEFRYRNPIINKDNLVIAVSQSGETADTVAAIELANKTAKTFSVCNVIGASLTRKVADTLYTRAGPEISVASTKAFTTQLTALYLLAVGLAKVKGAISASEEKKLVEDVLTLPKAFEEGLKLEKSIEKIAKKFYSARDYLFLGRGVCYPIALEGALKLKELSYIHAEGYPAGEMKHGPISLIDEKLPVVVMLQRDDILFPKILSNLREVESRGGKIIAITDSTDISDLKLYCDTVIETPYISPLLSPIIMTLPLQFLSYYVAVFNGTDVDLPRNLAKSVTVE